MNPDPDEHVYPGHEDLQWGGGIKEKNREKKPSSRYWAISEQARKMIPGESQCKMFCGGKACKYCTAELWTPEQQAVKGLYSEWVTDNILAMARPSNLNIDKYKMIEQFKELGIQTVINLQEPGEHVYCGYGNDSGGFSYSTHNLMEAGLFFYNFAMQDYGVAPMSTLLDIVKVMQFAVSQGKVAVHCHAGLGRTGLIIACYLIYNNRVKASKSIQYVRSRRKGSIQTKQQVKTCHEFEQYLEPFFIIFPSKIHDALEFSFSRFLIRQRNLLHGYEARKLKHIPKIVYVSCERLLELCGKGKALESLRAAVIDPIPPDLISIASQSLSKDSVFSEDSSFQNNLDGDNDNDSPQQRLNRSQSQKSYLKSMRDYPNVDSYEHTRKNSNSSTKAKVQYSLSAPTNLKPSGISPDRSSGISPRQRQSSPGKFQDDSKTMRDADEDEEEDDDDCIVYGLSNEQMELAAQKAEEELRKAEEEEIKMFKERKLSLRSSKLSIKMSVRDVCTSILTTEYSEQKRKAIDSIETALNKSDETWKLLASEEDPEVVSAVMWDWLDQLNEPILRAQDVSVLVENYNDPQRALMHIEKSTKHFLEYLARVLSKLQTGSSHEHQAVVERLLCHLCQKRLGLGLFPFSGTQAYVEEEKHDISERVFKLFTELIHLEKK
ncbi:protein tyrosine phosphatase domain-containing protein 1 [Aplysia californica]|uniref:Protein tyrosine phosphatase domain-containing protein 1 n=1 Tax=Aplysia californica TaxID=6500 RepID=A0ABM0ZYX2_APLCA|nr:protein tyrosine phosphatase domain-containing protein 1 [Aplysia californica]